MAPKIFLTGATGFIGGDALYALHEAHPEYEYTLLVRNEERGKAVAKQYPKARLVYGDLSASEVIEPAAAAADVVVHTADSSDDEPSAKAIIKGLAAGHTAEKPGFYIHVSGTNILSWYDETNKRIGQPPIPEQRYRDVTDVDRIVTIPDQADHRNVDKIVQAANSAVVKTAIVAPPTIYATGRGPVNTVSQQVPDVARFVLKQGFGPSIESGKTEWDNVHIWDLSKLFVSLVEAALDPEMSKQQELFGPKAYFFAENGTPHVWSEVSQWVVDEVNKKGYISSEAKVKQTSWDAIKDVDVANSTWVSNSSSVAERARKYLSWKPTHPSLKETIPEAVKIEADALGLKAKN